MKFFRLFFFPFPLETRNCGCLGKKNIWKEECQAPLLVPAKAWVLRKQPAFRKKAVPLVWYFRKSALATLVEHGLTLPSAAQRKLCTSPYITQRFCFDYVDASCSALCHKGEHKRGDKIWAADTNTVSASLHVRHPGLFANKQSSMTGKLPSSGALSAPF